MDNTSVVQYTTDMKVYSTTPRIPSTSHHNTEMQHGNDVTGTDGFIEFNVHVSTLVVCTIGNVFIMLLSCYGNGKFLVKCHQSVKHNRNSVLLKRNLSTGDFLLSLTQCPILMFLVFGMPVLANVLLPIAAFSAGLSLTVSLSSIAGIAIHRYLKLKCNRSSSSGNNRSVLIFILVTWILGIATAALFASLVAVQLGSFDVRYPDTIMNNSTLHVTVYIVVVLLLVTLVTVLYSYAALAVALYTGPTIKPCLPKFKTTSNGTQDSDTVHLSETCNNFENKYEAIASCAIIVVTHLILWLPFITIHSFDTLITDENASLNLKVIAWMLVLSQSALNPFLYRVPKDPVKPYFYCEQCLLFPQCQVHTIKQWPARNRQATIPIEISAESQPHNASDIFHITLPDENQCDNPLVRDTVATQPKEFEDRTENTA